MKHRRERVAHDVRARLAEILARHTRDARLASIVLTDVELSPDLSYARVFYRTAGEPREAARALERAGPFLRRRLAEGLSLRRVPELDFRLDDALERGARVEEILREIRERDATPTAPLAPEAEPDAVSATAAAAAGEGDPT